MGKSLTPSMDQNLIMADLERCADMSLTKPMVALKELISHIGRLSPPMEIGADLTWKEGQLRPTKHIHQGPEAVVAEAAVVVVAVHFHQLTAKIHFQTQIFFLSCSGLKMEIDISAYLSGLKVFIDTLRVISLSPADQSRMLGHYNAAWEVVQEIKAGSHLIVHSKIDVPRAIQEKTKNLSERATLIPERLLIAAEGEDKNIAALSDPAWQEIKVAALILLQEIEPFYASIQAASRYDDR